MRPRNFYAWRINLKEDNEMFKKVLALVLALLMVTAVFVGCQKKRTPLGGDSTKDTTASTTADTTNDDDAVDPDTEDDETDDTDSDTKGPNPFEQSANTDVTFEATDPLDTAPIDVILDPNTHEGADIEDSRDYDGYSFTVLCDTTNVRLEFIAESDGELIKDAVIQRQDYIEQFLNIDFNLVETQGGYGNMEGYAAEIESASGAGTPYDLALAYNLIPPVVAAKGLSRDLAESENLNLLETEKPYWGKEIKKEIMIGGRIFWMSDNSSWNNIRNMLCMYVNTEYFSRVNEGATKEDLYALVENGNWTIQSLLTLIQDAYENTNTEGDGAEGADDLDSYGLQAAESAAWLDNWVYAAGFRYTKLNAKGTYDWTLGDQSMIDFIDYWQETIHNDADIDKQDGTQYKMFLEGRSMFSLSTIGMNEQNPEIEYTVLPLPLYDSNVKNTYSTPFSNTYSSWLIPKAAKTEAFERSATTLEMLAAEGNRRLSPVYFEVYLKRQVANGDENMLRMFNIIRNSITFDLGYLYGSSLTCENLGGGSGYAEVFIFIRRIFAGDGTGSYSNISTVWPQISGTATTKLNNLMVDILDY